MKEIPDCEKDQFIEFWTRQRQAIEGRVSEMTMRWFNIYTAKDNVGYEFGQLRPGRLGQWDLYHNLAGPQSVGCDENEALIASGLTAAEVADEKRDEYYRENYVDPRNGFEITAFEQMERMSPEELDAEIASLEGKVAKMQPVTA